MATRKARHGMVGRWEREGLGKGGCFLFLLFFFFLFSLIDPRRKDWEEKERLCSWSFGAGCEIPLLLPLLGGFFL